jgi:hypothetical protein
VVQRPREEAGKDGEDVKAHRCRVGGLRAWQLTCASAKPKGFPPVP